MDGKEKITWDETELEEYRDLKALMEAGNNNDAVTKSKYTVTASSPQGVLQRKMSFATIVILQVLTLTVVVVVLGIAAITLYNEHKTKASVVATTCTVQLPDTGDCSASYNDTKITYYFANNSAMLKQIIEATKNTANCSLENIDSTLSNIQNISNTCTDIIADNKEILNQVFETTQNATTKLNNIISTLSNLKDTSVSTSGAVDDILIVVNELLRLQNGSVLFNSLTPVSCKNIKDTLPNSPSGYYHVNSRNIYCNMDELCGSTEGWTRIAYLDMTDGTQSCPSSLQLYTAGGKRACQRTGGGPSGICNSAAFQTNGISYSEICGRVHAYQYGHTDALSHGNHNSNYGIDDIYVDGVSITHGSPRQHVWTFMASLFEHYNAPASTCPCYEGSSVEIKSNMAFIGNDYFCESGNPNSYQDSTSYYTSDPLWDGEGCTSLETNCCSPPFNPPWFHKVLDNPTTDYIELRLCGNTYTSEENTPVYFYEIYVK